MERPLVVAHRGSSEHNAEHTLRAYIAALDEGADGLECDVRLTADGHLVCVHDRDLRRTAATDSLVSNMALADLEDLDFAGWKHPWADLDDEADPGDPEHDGVLTMRRLLTIVAEQPRRVELSVETKHPTRYAGLVERRLVELLDEFGWAGADSPARVMSFSSVALRRIRRLAPRLELVYLMDGATDWLRVRPMADPDWIAGPGIDLLRRYPEAIHKITDAGSRLHVWTVNEPADIERCLAQRAEAIITDRPSATRRYLDEVHW
ncbi:MAG: glycerophosphodiester phosphodiesterase family protein [Marmoricola sp.]